MKPYTCNLPRCLYLRDPEQTRLGQNILAGAIQLIDQIGIEALTFRKLAAEIASTEASIYRYFEDKYQLLRYLVAWYWESLHHQLDESESKNEQESQPEDPAQRLHQALSLLMSTNRDRYQARDQVFDQAALCRLVVREAPKVYFTAEPEYRLALFRGYEKLVTSISAILLAINPDYSQPKALVSSLIEIAQRQLLFAQYLPDLTELKIQTHDPSEIVSYLEGLALNMLAYRPENPDEGF